MFKNKELFKSSIKKGKLTMYKDKIKLFYLEHSNLIISVIFFCFYSYFFLAFLPEVSPTVTGLDPSWQYAISQAANTNLVFGKDIVFTYGPLGYLIGGSALEENFFQILYFRWLVYLTLFIVSLIRIKTVKNSLHKLTIGTAIILSLSIRLSGSTDYQILFIYLILLTFDSLFKRFPTLFPSLLGAIAGICLLTKFSLGISIIGSLSLFLIINLIHSLQSKSLSKINLDFFALLNSSLAAISTAWLFLYPNAFVQSLQTLIVIFVFSFSVASLVLYTKIIDKFKKIVSDKKTTLVSSSEEAKNVKIVDILNSSNFRIIFYTSYTILLLFFIFHSSYSLIDYFKNSLEISSGYSSAMSVVGNRKQLALALLNFVFVVFILFIIGKNNHLNLALALIFALWINFKHGFIRQDDHVAIFAFTVPVVMSLSLIKIKIYRQLKISAYVFLFICISSLFISPSTTQSISKNILNLQWSQVNNLNPKNVLGNISSVLHTENLKNEILRVSAKNLSASQLPNNIIKMVGNQTIDIIPWEVSLAPANNLNWQPRPIFQSYSAYTDKLDEINFISLSSKPRDFLFYNFQSIDERHPFFDEPKTFFYIFCNYQPATLLSNGQSILSILQKNKSTRCLPLQPENKITVAWNQVYAMNFSVDSIIRAKIQFHYSILGKLQKIFFRIPPVTIVVDYVDGSSQAYRIIPENSGNGVIISHLPRSDQDAVSLLQGNLLAQVKSFRFETSRPSLYQSNIEINFLSSKIK